MQPKDETQNLSIKNKGRINSNLPKSPLAPSINTCWKKVLNSFCENIYEVFWKLFLLIKNCQTG